MGAVTTPLPETLAVDPGGEVVAAVRVRNRSPVVDEFTFSVLGEPEGWTEVVPPSLSLFPNGEGVVELRFRPPRTPEAAPGLVPYALLVGSVNNADANVVEEGVLVVSSFHEASVQLTPRTSRGRRSGKHRIAVDNFGNAPAAVRFTAEDSENALRVTFRPEPLVVYPGAAGFARVKVKPRRRFLRGPDRVYPFRVHAVVDGAKAVDVEGLHIQHAVVPRLALPILLVLAAAVILWAVFKPQVNSTANKLAPAQALKRAANAAKLVHSDAVAAQMQATEAAKQVHLDAQQGLAAQTKAAAVARKDAQRTQKQAASAAAASKQAGTKADRAAVVADDALKIATPPFSGVPAGIHLALACPPTCTTTLLVPAGQTLYVSDVLLADPGVDAVPGEATVRLTLDGKPLLVGGLDSPRTLHYKPSTPLLLTGGQALALEVECLTPKSCPASSPSAYLGGFTPAAPPDAAGPNGAPVALRVDLKCPPGRTACSASAMVPARATAIDLTDVLLQNPANDTGTVTLKSAGKTILVEGLDSFRDLPFTFTAPLVLAPRAQVTLSVKCTNPEKNCTPGVLLAGVLHEPPPSK